MDWSVLIYFLAAVLTAAVGYALWPDGSRQSSRQRPEVAYEPFRGDASEEDATPSTI